MRRIGAAAIVAFAAWGGTAQAATLTPDKACYLEREQAEIRGSGFGPGSAVSFSFGGDLVGSAAADAAGNVLGSFIAPSLGTKAARSFRVQATDGVNSATTRVAVTQRMAEITPGTARLDRRVLYRVRGLRANRAVYVHYVYRGKERMRRRLGRAAGPCGTVTTRTRFFPRGRISRGVWTLQFDHRRTYSRGTTPKIRAQVRVFRTLRSSARRSASWSGHARPAASWSGTVRIAASWSRLVAPTASWSAAGR
jgi:hypothetical protein